MSSAVRRLLPYVNRYRRAFIIGMVCVFSTTTFQLLSPWILKYAIDDLNHGVTRQKLADVCRAPARGLAGSRRCSCS